MGLKMISHNSEEHPGYRAGSGTIDTYVYECPCRNGRIVRTTDNIPGFRDSDIVIEFDKCREKYGNISSLSELE